MEELQTFVEDQNFKQSLTIEPDQQNSDHIDSHHDRTPRNLEKSASFRGSHAETHSTHSHRRTYSDYNQYVSARLIRWLKPWISFVHLALIRYLHRINRQLCPVEFPRRKVSWTTVSLVIVCKRKLDLVSRCVKIQWLEIIGQNLLGQLLYKGNIESQSFVCHSCLINHALLMIVCVSEKYRFSHDNFKLNTTYFSQSRLVICYR